MFRIPEGVHALSLDVWGTILQGNDAFRLPRLHRLFDFLGLKAPEGRPLYQAYLRADLFYNSEAESSGLDYGLRSRLAMMYKDLGIATKLPPSEDIMAIQVELGQMRLQTRFMPSLIEDDLPATLARLKSQGYTIGTLSNTGVDIGQNVRPILQKLGVWDHLDCAIFSNEDGRAKPNPGLFQLMAKHLHAKPHAVLHIGDTIRADYGAVHAGLKAAVYAPHGVEDYPYVNRLSQLV